MADWLDWTLCASSLLGCEGDPLVLPATDPRLQSQIGIKEDGLLHIDAPGHEGDRHFGLFGPYLELPKGDFRAELQLVARAPPPKGGTIIIDVCRDAGQLTLCSRECSDDEIAGVSIRVDFSIAPRVKDLEIRLNVPGGFSGSIKQLSIRALGQGCLVP